MEERGRGRGKEKGSEKAVEGGRKRALSENAGKGDPWGPGVGLASAAPFSMVERFMIDMISDAVPYWLGANTRENETVNKTRDP